MICNDYDIYIGDPLYIYIHIIHIMISSMLFYIIYVYIYMIMCEKILVISCNFYPYQ